MGDQPILIEDEEGLNVVTTLEEARKQIELLRLDNSHLRKSVMTYKNELNQLYDALTTIKQAMRDGIDIILQARTVK